MYLYLYSEHKQKGEKIKTVIPINEFLNYIIVKAYGDDPDLPVKSIKGYGRFIVEGKNFTTMQLIDVCQAYLNILVNMTVTRTPAIRMKSFFGAPDRWNVFLRTLIQVTITISGVMQNIILADVSELVRLRILRFMYWRIFQLCQYERKIREKLPEYLKEATNFGLYRMFDEQLHNGFKINDFNVGLRTAKGDLQKFISAACLKDNGSIKIKTDAGSNEIILSYSGAMAKALEAPFTPRISHPSNNPKPRPKPKERRKNPYISIKKHAQRHGVQLSNDQMRSACKFFNWYGSCKSAGCKYADKCIYCGETHGIKFCQKLVNDGKK